MRIGYFLSSEEWGPAELYIQQIGPDQDAFFEAWREQSLPRVRGSTVTVG